MGIAKEVPFFYKQLPVNAATKKHDLAGTVN